jgi:hypothetical protein
MSVKCLRKALYIIVFFLLFRPSFYALKYLFIIVSLSRKDRRDISIVEKKLAQQRERRIGW